MAQDSPPLDREVTLAARVGGLRDVAGTEPDLVRLGEAHGHPLADLAGPADDPDPHSATSGARICSSSAAPVTPSRRRMTFPSFSITRVGTTLIR